MNKTLAIKIMTAIILSGCSSAFAQLAPGVSWYWQLQGKVNETRDAKVYGVDLEDNEKNGLIGRLKAKGKTVICYFSAGTYENWRKDAKDFPKIALGKSLDEWPGERWVDVRNNNVRMILAKRMDRAKAAGCDGVDPDNVDGYSNKNGLGLTIKDQLAFLGWLSRAAHNRGLLVGLKNGIDMFVKEDLSAKFDFEVNEQCYQYNECATLKKFIEKGKPVFIAEYEESSTKFCDKAIADKFSLVIYGLSLNGSLYLPCN